MTCDHCLDAIRLSGEMNKRTSCHACVSFYTSNGYWPDQQPFPFIEKPAAKSSTMTLVASVCQLCGHKLDGKIGGNGDVCSCRCHAGRV